jgi:hypothetical protein
VRSAPDEHRGRVGVGHQSQLLLAVQPRAVHEVDELVAGEEFAGPGVIFVGRLGAEHAEVDHQVMFIGLRHLGLPGGRRVVVIARHRVFTRPTENLALTP